MQRKSGPNTEHALPKRYPLPDPSYSISSAFLPLIIDQFIIIIYYYYLFVCVWWGWEANVEALFVVITVYYFINLLLFYFLTQAWLILFIVFAFHFNYHFYDFSPISLFLIFKLTFSWIFPNEYIKDYTLLIALQVLVCNKCILQHCMHVYSFSLWYLHWTINYLGDYI